jgi:hypothetical protein
MSNNLIQNSFHKAYSYSSYRSIIKRFIEEGKSTAKEHTDALLDYSILNDKRMDRLDKTLKITDKTLNYIQNLKDELTFLVISEGWCGDAAQVVPIINKISETSGKIDLKIVLRDKNEELMNLFLTNGNKSIPKIILVDRDYNIISSWGPRPSIATKMVLAYKAKNGILDAKFKKNLQLWYNKDKGNNTQEDIVKLLKVS